MSQAKQRRNWTFLGVGLGAALVVAVALSPFASSDPDGLDRVAQDQQFDSKAEASPASHQLPFYQVFEEYAVRGVPEAIATPLAGLVGTLVTFGLAWGIGKLAVRSPSSSSPAIDPSGQDAKD